MTAEHPEGWTPDPDHDDLDRALERIEREAGQREGNYAAGMRAARLIVEEETKR